MPQARIRVTVDQLRRYQATVPEIRVPSRNCYTLRAMSKYSHTLLAPNPVMYAVNKIEKKLADAVN